MAKAYASRDIQSLLKYNCLDTVATARSYFRMRAEPEWDTARVRRLYFVHRELARIASEMYQAGFYVDKEERKRLADLLYETYKQREEAFLKLVNVPGMKCQPSHMRSLIYARHRTDQIHRFDLPDPVVPQMWVEKKFQTVSVDQSALLLQLVHPACPPELVPIVEAYWQAEGAWKARSTYVVSERVEHAIGRDGRLRAGWNSCGTDTGRWSCSRPNLMNLSEKKDEDGGALQGDLPSMRAMYRASPGNVLVHADYSQLELRVMAAVSGDSTLADALSSGDVYTSDAIDIFHLPPDSTKKTIKPQARKAAKIGHLGFQYGAGEPALYMQFLEQDRTITFRQVQIIRKALMDRYTGTVQYWADEHARVNDCGYSESRVLNRRRTYPREPPPTETANYPIQSTASDIANLSMIELDRRLKKHVPGARILVQLHDAFDVECKASDQGRVRDIMQECMEKPYVIEGREYVFPVEIKVGEKWSEV